MGVRVCVIEIARTHKQYTHDSVLLTMPRNTPIETRPYGKRRERTTEMARASNRATRPNSDDGHEQTDSAAMRAEPGGEARGALRSRRRRGRIAAAAVTSGVRRDGGGMERGAFVRFRRASTPGYWSPRLPPASRALSPARALYAAELCSVVQRLSLASRDKRSRLGSIRGAHTCTRTYAGGAYRCARAHGRPCLHVARCIPGALHEHVYTHRDARLVTSRPGAVWRG